jgi:hypothetical protein
MAGSALLSQVEGLLEQCAQEYPDPKVDALLDGVRSVMEEMRASEGGQEEENPLEDALEGGTEEPAEGDFKAARKAAMDSGVMQKEMRGPKNRQPKAEEEVQAEDDEKKRRKSKAF